MRVPRGSANRVKRGGSWNNSASNAKSANQNGNTPENRNDDNGVRPSNASLRPIAPAKPTRCARDAQIRVLRRRADVRRPNPSCIQRAQAPTDAQASVTIHHAVVSI